MPAQSPSTTITPTSNKASLEDLAARVETCLPLPSFPPSALDWMTYRSVICTLYRNRKLRQVQQIMKDTYGFNATETMYKKRISVWKIGKNYRAQEKRVVAQMVNMCHKNAMPINDITVRGQPADFGKIRRFCRDERFLEDILPILAETTTLKLTKDTQLEDARPNAPVGSEISYQTAQSASKRDGLTGSNDVLYKSNLVLPDIQGTSEILHYIETFIKCQYLVLIPRQPLDKLRPRQVNATGGQKDDDGTPGKAICPQLMWEKYVYGLMSLQVNELKQGYHLLDEVCQHALDTLRQNPMDLLCNTFLTFCDTTWQDFPGLRAHLIRYLVAMSNHALGETHPVTKALYCLRREGLVTVAAEACFLKLITTLEMVPEASQYDLNRARRNFCDLLRRNQHLTSAEKASLHMVKQSERIYGKTHPLTRRDLRRLVHVYADQGRYEIAQKTCLDLLQRGGAWLIANSVDRDGLSETQLSQAHITTAAWRDMATICRRYGDLKVAQQWQERTVDGYVLLSGFEDLETATTISKLEFLMNAQGNRLAAQLLRQQYPDK